LNIRRDSDSREHASAKDTALATSLRQVLRCRLANRKPTNLWREWWRCQPSVGL